MESKGELVTEIKEKASSTTVGHFSPLGIRLDFHMQGEVKGKYNGTHIETSETLFRHDGIVENHGRAIEFTKEGDLVFIVGKGIAKPVDQTTLKGEGEIRWQTHSPRLAWLNSKKGRFEGTFNQATGEVVIRTYSLD